MDGQVNTASLPSPLPVGVTTFEVLLDSSHYGRLEHIAMIVIVVHTPVKAEISHHILKYRFHLLLAK